MAKNKMNLKASLLAVVLAASAAGMLGCSAEPTTNNDFFPPSEASQEKKMMEAQAAVGARADASLYTKHFDGNALNSLGKAKLDLMTASLPDEGPITVYLDLPKVEDKTGADKTTADKTTSDKVSADKVIADARMDAVKDYLINSHLTADQFKLIAGPNADTSHPTADAITNYAKTDTGTGSAGGSSGGSSSSASTSTK